MSGDACKTAVTMGYGTLSVPVAESGLVRRNSLCIS